MTSDFWEIKTYFFSFQMSDKTIKVLMFQGLINSDRLTKYIRVFSLENEGSRDLLQES